MSKDNNNSSMSSFTETILVTVVMVICALLGIYFTPCIFILYPIPFIILGIRRGIKYNVASIMISSLAIALFVDKLSGLFVFIAFGPLAICINYMMEKRKKSDEILLWSSIINLISYLIVIGFIGKVSGVSFINQIDNAFTEAFKTQVTKLKDMGLTPTEMHKAENFIENAIDYMVLIVPSMVIIFSAFSSYVDYWLSTVILRKMGYGIHSVPKFSYFILPNNIILGIIIIFLGALLLKVLKLFYYETIFINISLLSSFIFFLEGLAVIVFFMNKAKINIIFRIIIVVFFIVSIPLSAIISIVGILDVIFDFRKMRKLA